jgi:uncharacterized protein YxeA
MKKGAKVWGMIAILLIIVFCSAFYLYRIHGTMDDSLMTEIADINTTASASKNLPETNRTANQSTFTVPLEKPPFID